MPLVKPDELREWLLRKAKIRCRDIETGENVPGGFLILEPEDKPLEIRPMMESHFRKKEHSAYHGGVQFRGILEVTDRDCFIKTYQAGIGGGKGFGFGLLLLAPINM